MEYKYRRPWFSNAGDIRDRWSTNIVTMVLKRWGCGRDRWSINIVDHGSQTLGMCGTDGV